VCSSDLLEIKDSYYGLLITGATWAYLSGENLISSNGSDGINTQASGGVELASGVRLAGNGGWGAYAQYSSSGNVSLGTFFGNSAGTHSHDATSITY